MEFISVKEAAQRWGISERRVRALCESGRIEGVTRCGEWVWSIPAGTQRPADGRTLRYIKNRNLRTGVQDYHEVDALRKRLKQTQLTDEQKAGVILQALTYADINVNTENISETFKLNKQEISLSTQIEILNMRGALSNLPVEISEKSITNLNSRILMSVDEKNGGNYQLRGTEAQEMEAMLEQYAGAWSILHPVARATFLFAEIIRIQPFVKANIETAFVLLASELVKAKLPPAIFDAEQIPELKAALASAEIRGNTQTLVSMIIDAITK